MTEKSFFDWIAASLLQDCGLPRESWQEVHSREASGQFSDETLQRAATILAVLHPYVIDYIRQAPVLVVAAAGERRLDLTRRNDRLAFTARFIARAGSVRRLPAILKAYGVAPPLKRLDSHVLSASHARLLPALLQQPEVVLAQVVPAEAEEQRCWLYWARQLVDRLQGARTAPSAELAWCLAHLTTPERREHTMELIDWMADADEAFHPKMRFDEAWAATEKWHAQQARTLAGRRHPYDESKLRTIDYGPLPTQWSRDGLTFKAITTYVELDEESVRMHHCVRTYWPRILAGTSRIYSVRRQGLRIATLELDPSEIAPRAAGVRVIQLRGPCNARVATDVSATAAAFCAAANAAVAKAAADNEARAHAVEATQAA